VEVERCGEEMLKKLYGRIKNQEGMYACRGSGVYAQGIRIGKEKWGVVILRRDSDCVVRS